MKIGIDAKWYFEGPPSGKRVVRNLVNSMLSIDDRNEYVVFLDRRHKDRKFPRFANAKVTMCYIWAGNNALSNLFVVPFYSFRQGVDATLYQTFISPFDRAKKVAYIHDVLFLSNPEYYTLVERIYFSPLKLLTKWSTAIVTVSETEKNRLLRYKYSTSPEKIVVAYHGVEDSFRPREAHPAAEIEGVRKQFNLPDRFLLFVGRLNLRKNVDNLLRAIPLLRDKTIPLIIVGSDNWKKSNHEDIVKQSGVHDRIHFKGAVYKELSAIYSMSTIFCFPSYAESFGLPPLEAMACGVPVVTSNTTSLPEICGDAGSYVNPERPEEIADAIDNLLINAQLYQEKKTLGLQQASKFTWDAAAKTIINCLESCIKKIS